MHNSYLRNALSWDGISMICSNQEISIEGILGCPKANG